MHSDIRVSFKDNEEEDRLYDDIINDCGLIGKSAWMKIAAREKLERDHGSKIQRINIDSTAFTGGIINSMDQFFK